MTQSRIGRGRPSGWLWMFLTLSAFFGPTARAQSRPEVTPAQVIAWMEVLWDPDKHSRELAAKAIEEMLKVDGLALMKCLEAVYQSAPEDGRLDEKVRTRARTWVARTVNHLTIALAMRAAGATTIEGARPFAGPRPPFVEAAHQFCLKRLEDPQTRSDDHRIVWLQAANNLKMNQDLRVVDFYIDRMTDPRTSRRFRLARVRSFNQLLAATWNPDAFAEVDRLPELRKELQAWWAQHKPYAEYFFQEQMITKPYIRLNWLVLDRHAQTGQFPPFDYIVQWIATNSAYKVQADESLRAARLPARLDVRARTLEELLPRIAEALGLTVEVRSDEVIFRGVLRSPATASRPAADG